MKGGFTLDYRLDVRSAADAHHVRTLNELMEGSYNPVEWRMDTDSPFSGRLMIRASGEIGLLDCRLDSSAGSNACFTSWRARSHIARNKAYGLNIVIWLGGETDLDLAGRGHLTRPGDFLVMDTEIPFRARMRAQAHAFNLALPESWGRIGDIKLEDVFGNIRTQGSDRHGLMDYVRRLRAHPDALDAPGAANELYDVLVLALDPRAASEHASGMLAMICAYIDAHYARHDLGAELLAARYHISLRQLQRLFAARGLTFTEYLTEKRLVRAHQMLADPRRRQQSILSIAYRCGFRDINHFGRRFRARYGMTPSECRRIQLPDSSG